MNLSKNNNLITGFIKYSMAQNKNLYIIAAVVLSFVTLGNIVYTIINYSLFSDASIDTIYYGMSLGTPICLWTTVILMFIAAFISVSKTNINRMLKFPLSREALTIGSFINIILNAFIMLFMVIIVIFTETIFAHIFSSFFQNVELVNDMTLKNFLTGLWLTLSIIILTASIARCLGIYFFRFFPQTPIILCILIMLISIVPFLGRIFFKGIINLYDEPSFLLFSIKIWLLIILVSAVSYLPLRKMEVTL